MKKHITLGIILILIAVIVVFGIAFAKYKTELSLVIVGWSYGGILWKDYLLKHK